LPGMVGIGGRSERGGSLVGDDRAWGLVKGGSCGKLALSGYAVKPSAV